MCPSPRSMSGCGNRRAYLNKNTHAHQMPINDQSKIRAKLTVNPLSEIGKSTVLSQGT